MVVRISTDEIEIFKKCVELNEPFSLQEIKMHVAERCNLRCRMCRDWSNHSGAELSFEEIKDIIDQAKKLGLLVLKIFGGEPTLRKDLPEIVCCCHDKGIATKMTTNGTLINRKLAYDLVKSGLSEIVFSVDSFSSDIHDKLRGVPGSWKKTDDAINFVTEAKKSCRSNLRISANTVVTRCNYESLPLLFRYFASKSIKRPILIPVIVDPDETEKSELLLRRNDILTYNHKILPQLTEIALEESFDIKEEELQMYGTTDEEIESSTKSHYSARILVNAYCFKPWYDLSIRGNGDVSPCNMIKEKRYNPIGNVKNENLEQIWFSDRYREFRMMCKRKFEQCKRCCYSRSAICYSNLMKRLYGDG